MRTSFLTALAAIPLAALLFSTNASADPQSEAKELKRSR